MSVGDTIVRTGSFATIGELAQRVEQLERFLSGGVGPVDLLGAASHGAVDLGAPAQAWRRLYALGITVGGVDLDLTTIAQQLAATAPAIYTAGGAHDATTDITTLRFLVLAQGGGGGGAAGSPGSSDTAGGPGASGTPAPLTGAIIVRAVSSDPITVTVGAGGAGGAASSHPSDGPHGLIGGATTVAVAGVIRATASGGPGGQSTLALTGDFNRPGGGATAGNVPGAGGRGGGTNQQGDEGIQGPTGFALLIPVA